MNNATPSISPMRLASSAALLAAVLAAAPAAQAHVTYTGRQFGSFGGHSSAATVTIANQAVTGNYGWADAADADWGDSHKGKWYSFTLTQATTVTLTAAAKADATATSVGGLIPAFSLYHGLAPISFDLATGTSSLSYDTSVASTAYKAALGFPVEGVWNALGNFSIGNDAGVLAPLSYVGSALDGAGYLGDGLADGRTSKTFVALAAGSYSVIVGGGDYLAQLAGNPLHDAAYGVSLTLTAAPVPEPQSLALLLAGGLVLARTVRRR